MTQQKRDRDMVDSDAAIELLLLAGPRKQVAPEREQRALARVELHWQRQVAARRRRRNQILVVAPLAAAASLLVAAVLLWHTGPVSAPEVATVEVVRGSLLWLSEEQQHELAVGAVVREGSTIATGEQDRAALRLADGSSMRLDTGARLTFVEKELVRLEGGAVYLDSGVETGLGTMIVSTPLGEVSDVGTQYEVRLLDDGLRIRVREGLVSLQRDHQSEEIRAGEELLLQADGALLRREIGATDPGWAWLLEVAPPFHLPGRSAASFLRWVQRENGYVLRWAEPSMASQAETIILQGDLTGIRPDEAADLVLPTCGLSYRLEEGVLTVDIMPTR